MNFRTPLRATLLIAVLCFAASARADYFADFDAGAPAEFSGVTTTESVQGYAGIGPASNQFGGLFLRNDSAGNPASATVLTLTDLAPHSSISLGFLLAIIDSWDGSDGNVAPDTFNVEVDGVPVFVHTFAIASGTGDYTPPPGVLLSSVSNLGFGGSWNDNAYNMSLEPAFQSIAHSASTLTIRWYASGAGWQAGIDESWAIDNVSVTLNGAAVPEPSSLGLLAAGAAGLVMRRRRG